MPNISLVGIHNDNPNHSLVSPSAQNPIKYKIKPMPQDSKADFQFKGIQIRCTSIPLMINEKVIQFDMILDLISVYELYKSINVIPISVKRAI